MSIEKLKIEKTNPVQFLKSPACCNCVFIKKEQGAVFNTVCDHHGVFLSSPDTFYCVNHAPIK